VLLDAEASLVRALVQGAIAFTPEVV